MLLNIFHIRYKNEEEGYFYMQFENLKHMKNKVSLSCLDTDKFDKLVDGKRTQLVILRNKNGAEVTITNFGAKIVSIMVPDRKGVPTDVVTGHNSIDEYLTSEEPYFGAVCGRFGNRIAKGKFSIEIGRASCRERV